MEAARFGAGEEEQTGSRLDVRSSVRQRSDDDEGRQATRSAGRVKDDEN